jgi:Kelch motif
LSAYLYSRVSIFALALVIIALVVTTGQSTAASGLGTPTSLNIPNPHFDGSVASVGNKVLFAGGASNNFQDVSDIVDIYDATTGLWTMANLSQPRHALTSVTLGTKVFFAGGNSGGSDSSRVDIYDSQTNNWSTAELSEPRGYVSPVAVGGKVLFAGGWDANVARSTVDIYDTQSNSWTSTTLSEPTSGQYQATSVGNLALIANNDSVDIYNSQTNSWSTPHPLSHPRSTVAAITLGTQVIIAGGQDAFGGTDAVDIYDSQSDQWHTANLSEGRFTSPVVFDGKAYFMGGWTGSSASATIDVYDGSTWSIDSLPGAAWGVGPVVADGKLLVEEYGSSALVYDYGVCAAMAWPWVVSQGDNDCDGFTDAQETFVGTDPLVACGGAALPDGSSSTWPPDFNSDQRVNLQDVLKFSPVFNTIGPGLPYNKRFDLNADGKIGLPDILKLSPFFNQSCSP